MKLRLDMTESRSVILGTALKFAAKQWARQDRGVLIAFLSDQTGKMCASYCPPEEAVRLLQTLKAKRAAN